MSGYDLNQGVREFYASQAEALLSQWQNIEQLLGPTSDFTAPGTHCEVLLRDFLRKQFPAWVSVDKGFIYGRTHRWTTVTEHSKPVEKQVQQHGPEIDLLIHDTLLYRPVFRLEDFVIVQPQAVLGMIQVKRSFQANEFREAIDNITDGKRHFLETYFALNDSREHLPSRDVFSAAVEFTTSNRQDDTFRDRLRDAYDWQSKYEDWKSKDVDGKDMQVHTRTWTLPEFIGSLGGKFAVKASRNEQTGIQVYQVFDGYHNDRNVALQELLIKLTSVIWSWSSSTLQKVSHEKPILAPTLDSPVKSAFAVPHDGS